MNLLLMLATVIAALILLGALLYFVSQIGSLLEQIGGNPTSFLAKLRLGLRAIETETGHLAPMVIPVNEDLTAVAEGLVATDQFLKDTATSAIAQEKSS